jgi:hypothetical protein
VGRHGGHGGALLLLSVIGHAHQTICPSLRLVDEAVAVGPLQLYSTAVHVSVNYRPLSCEIPRLGMTYFRTILVLK